MNKPTGHKITPAGASQRWDVTGSEWITGFRLSTVPEAAVGAARASLSHVEGAHKGRPYGAGFRTIPQ